MTERVHTTFFGARTMPKIGEVVRCRRCRATWLAVELPTGSDADAKLLHTSDQGISEAAAMLLTADVAVLFCPLCETTIDRAGVALKAHAVATGKAGN